MVTIRLTHAYARKIMTITGTQIAVKSPETTKTPALLERIVRTLSTADRTNANVQEDTATALSQNHAKRVRICFSFNLYK